MTQENFTEDIRRPGVFHGVPQQVADRFEKELDSYSWNLGGLSAGKLYKVVRGFFAVVHPNARGLRFIANYDVKCPVTVT